MRRAAAVAAAARRSLSRPPPRWSSTRQRAAMTRVAAAASARRGACSAAAAAADGHQHLEASARRGFLPAESRAARPRLDQGGPGLLLLEHLNLNVRSTAAGDAFYGGLLGCTRDPRRGPAKTPHHNCGAMTQFHTASPATEEAVEQQGPQVWMGIVTVCYSPGEFASLLDRVSAWRRDPPKAMADTKFAVDDIDESSGKIRVTCPYGNRFELREATEAEQRALGGSVGRRPGSLPSRPVGIAEVAVEVPRGRTGEIAEFYRTVFGFAVTEDEEGVSGRRATLHASGPTAGGQKLTFVEVDDPPASTGEHLALYIGNFEETFSRCLDRGAVWVNPRFIHLDNATDIDSARSYQQFRIRHMLRPKDHESHGEPIFMLEHEVRSVMHKSCPLAGETDADPKGRHPHLQSTPYTLPGGITAVDHRIEVPLNWADGADANTISVYAREVFRSEAAPKRDELPVLLFLQGGPGYPSPRPPAPSSGWMKRALEEYRVLLLDQRGTGLSTALNAGSLERLSGSSDPAAQASFLSHFRQDSIVRDAEAMREALGTKAVTLLGQSFGGFCILSYLSFFPESVEAAVFTVGLAPVGATVDEVYSHTYRRVYERNRRYYQRYPMDEDRVREIVEHLKENDVRLPSGGLLTPRRFLQLGLALGSRTGMETLHYLVESAWDAGAISSSASGRSLSYTFLREVEAMQNFDTNPIYWLLHEAIYVDGGRAEEKMGRRMEAHASSWSADRVLKQMLGEMPEFDYSEIRPDRPVYFTGEMVYPWMGDGDYPTLSKMKEAANILASKNDWGSIYDLDALRNTKVPCAALISYEDLYVERKFSEQTAALLGDKCKVWVTNEYQHSALRDDGEVVLDTLLGMIKDETVIPS